MKRLRRVLAVVLTLVLVLSLFSDSVLADELLNTISAGDSADLGTPTVKLDVTCSKGLTHSVDVLHPGDKIGFNIRWDELNSEAVAGNTYTYYLPELFDYDGAHGDIKDGGGRGVGTFSIDGNVFTFAIFPNQSLTYIEATFTATMPGPNENWQDGDDVEFKWNDEDYKFKWVDGSGSVSGSKVLSEFGLGTDNEGKTCFTATYTLRFEVTGHVYDLNIQDILGDHLELLGVKEFTYTPGNHGRSTVNSAGNYQSNPSNVKDSGLFGNGLNLGEFRNGDVIEITYTVKVADADVDGFQSLITDRNSIKNTFNYQFKKTDDSDYNNQVEGEGGSGDVYPPQFNAPSLNKTGSSIYNDGSDYYIDWTITINLGGYADYLKNGADLKTLADALDCEATWQDVLSALGFDLTDTLGSGLAWEDSTTAVKTLVPSDFTFNGDGTLTLTYKTKITDSDGDYQATYENTVGGTIGGSSVGGEYGNGKGTASWGSGVHKEATDHKPEGGKSVIYWTITVDLPQVIDSDVVISDNASNIWANDANGQRLNVSQVVITDSIKVTDQNGTELEYTIGTPWGEGNYSYISITVPKDKIESNGSTKLTITLKTEITLNGESFEGAFDSPSQYDYANTAQYGELQATDDVSGKNEPEQPEQPVTPSVEKSANIVDPQTNRTEWTITVKENLVDLIYATENGDINIKLTDTLPENLQLDSVPTVTMLIFEQNASWLQWWDNNEEKSNYNDLVDIIQKAFSYNTDNISATNQFTLNWNINSDTISTIKSYKFGNGLDLSDCVGQYDWLHDACILKFTYYTIPKNSLQNDANNGTSVTYGNNVSIEINGKPKGDVTANVTYNVKPKLTKEGHYLAADFEQYMKDRYGADKWNSINQENSNYKYNAYGFDNFFFVIEVNPERRSMIELLGGIPESGSGYFVDGDGKIKLVDEMGKSLNLILDSLRVYEIAEDGTESLLNRSQYTVSYEQKDNENDVLTITVPDSKYIRITYWANLTLATDDDSYENGKLVKGTVEDDSNKVSISGVQPVSWGGSNTSDRTLDAAVSAGTGGSSVTIEKFYYVGSDIRSADGAVFELTQVEYKDGKFVPVDGGVSATSNSAPYKFTGLDQDGKGHIYRLREVIAPEGLMIEAGKQDVYFVIKENYKKGEDSVLDKLIAGEGDVKVVLYSSGDPVYLENKLGGVSGWKAINGRDWDDDVDNGAYSFTIKSLKDAPPPTDLTVTNVGEKFYFPQVQYSLPGTYYYLVTENTTDVENVTYDTSVFLVKVEVTSTDLAQEGAITYTYYKKDASGSEQFAGITEIKDDKFTHVDKIEFVNEYDEEDDIPSEAELTLDIYKTFTGYNSKNDQDTKTFTFKIAADGIPDGAVINGDGTATITVKGGVTDERLENAFKITFTASDTYKFTIKEVGATPANGITYDTSVYEVTVTVDLTKNESERVTYTVSKKDDPSAESAEVDDKKISFINTYKAADLTNASVTLHKNYNGSIAKEFSFKVTVTECVENGMKFGDTILKVNDVAQNIANITAGNGNVGNITVGPFTFTEAGEYKVKVEEDVPESADPQITYDRGYIIVTFKVKDNGAGNLVLDGDPTVEKFSSDETEFGDASSDTFYNTYTALTSTQFKLTGTKVVDGDDYNETAEYSYEFTVTYPVTPSRQSGGNKTVNGVAPGSFTFFDDFEFTEADISDDPYVFEIRENVVDTNEGIEIDNSVYKVYVTVSKDGTSVKAEITKVEKVKGATTTEVENKSITFTNKYNKNAPTETSLSFNVVKSMDENSDPIPNGKSYDFEFVISATDDTPKDGWAFTTDDNKFTATIDSDNSTAETSAFGIKFTAADTYTFKVVETESTDRGITNADYYYIITVEVDMEDGANKLEIKSQTVEKYSIETDEPIEGTSTTLGESVEFVNTYSHGKTSADLEFTKNLVGADLQSGMFSFIMTDVTDYDSGSATAVKGGMTFTGKVATNGSVPEDEVNYVAEADPAQSEEQPVDSSSVKFGTIKFTKPGTYKVEVRELVKSETDGYTYDKSVYTVTFKVEDKGGYLEVTSTAYSKTYDKVTDDGKTERAENESVNKDELVFNNKYEASGRFSFTLDKSYKDSNGNKMDIPAETFEFTAEVQDNKSGVTVSDGKIYADANGKITVSGTIDDGASGDYTIVVKEVKGNAPGVTYDEETIIKVTFTVEDDGNGKLTVKDDKYTVSPEGAEFSNIFTAATATLTASKTLTGRAWKNNETFNFILNQVDENGELVKVVDTKSVMGKDGSVDFTTLSFEEGGTYYYTITEVAPETDENGIIYDREPRNVTIVVSDDLKNVTVTIDGEETSTASFENKYSSNGSVTLKLLKKLVDTATSRDVKFNAGDFVFEITSEDLEIAVPTVTNGANGIINIGEFSFTEAGDYTVTVTEKSSNRNGVPIVTDPMVVTFHVTDDNLDGTLTVTVEIDGTVYDPEKLVELGIGFTNTYTAAPVDVNIPVVKTLTGRAWADGDSFTFTIIGEDVDGYAITNNSVTITSASGTTDVLSINFTKAGTYTFTVAEENAGKTIKGVKYAEPVTVTYTVTDDGNGNLTVNGTASAVTVSALSFTNTYSHGTVDAAIKVTKNLVGRAWTTTDSFSFVLKNAAGEEIETVTVNSNNPSGVFAPITYDKAGTYEYTVTEVNGGIDGIVYDTTAHKVTVTVEDIGGELRATIDYDGADALIVTNTYEAPKTGDLTVTKTVSGNAASTVRRFTFRVVLSDTSVNGFYGQMNFVNGVATFTLAHGERITATGLPAGITYSVIELDAADYIATALGANGTITADGNAIASFVNYKEEYREEAPKVGGLVVQKTVEGDTADYTKQFTFTVTLSDTAINGVYGELRFVNGVAIFTLAHGESVSASGLPAGVRYTVTEDDYGDYIVTSEGETGTIAANSSALASFVNTLEAPETGTLVITKNVSGAAGEADRLFSFTVTLSDDSINGAYGDLYFVNGVAEILLRHGESAIATGIPAGTGYTVVENDADDYILTVVGDAGVIVADEAVIASFVNHKDESEAPEEEYDENGNPYRDDDSNAGATGDRYRDDDANAGATGDRNPATGNYELEMFCNAMTAVSIVVIISLAALFVLIVIKKMRKISE